MTDVPSPAEFWEARYADTERVWSGRVNRVVADVAGPLAPGRSLDLGCGEGGDVLWLAARGWEATGVDLSPTAVSRARAAADAAGLGESARFESADLAAWEDEDRYDLVTASFLQSWPVEIPREDILRRATGLVAPGGLILVVAHAGPPSWADPESVRSHPFPAPAEDLRALSLDRSSWQVLACETRERAATAPDGASGTLADGVVLARRVR
ncbi:class I SAM-dependent methyltransferase [Microbacterium marinilacus]|uniref:Class I SAM-dependent methyltransferase n=1 Tax=Microbacterium marinilacus TaxID=415209 RepID=A0ABP7BR14_9MICO|nr:class I SAM-dependent methyltransferase [Microbacterium marinilacus]